MTPAQQLMYFQGNKESATVKHKSLTDARAYQAAKAREAQGSCA